MIRPEAFLEANRQFREREVGGESPRTGFQCRSECRGQRRVPLEIVNLAGGSDGHLAHAANELDDVR
ncbi:hypothetical protein ACFQMM_24300 [Saliphagus sp. GCM10025308]